ncbi:MAG: outer membrane protein assembly factor BamE [Parvularculaceae bacterium]
MKSGCVKAGAINSGRIIALLVVLAGLSGCVSYRSAHGYVLERGETELTAKSGVDTKESVLAKYGEPSMIGTFDRNRWYYLYSLDAARAFFRPRITARTVIEFRFAEDGKVTDVNEINLADSVDVKMASRETPTRGKELGFWEQLLGNVGQLPAGGLGGQQQGGGGPPR